MNQQHSPNQTRNAPTSVQPGQQYQAGPPAHPQQTGLMSGPIPRQKQFWISYRSDMDGQLYEGQFTTKKLSLRDVAAIGVRKVQLNGGFHHLEDHPGVGVDAQTDWLNTVIAHLEVALVQAPIWYKLDELIDATLLGKIFEEVMEFENSFFRPDGQSDVNRGGSQGAGGPQNQGAGTVGSVAQVVGGQVSPSLDP